MFAAELERNPLRNVVLLKHLMAYPHATTGFRVADRTGSAHLVLIDAAASAFDRATYPNADVVALVSSDHPALTSRLLDALPAQRGIVFKLALPADRHVVAARFPIELKARFLSFTAPASVVVRSPGVQVGCAPDETTWARLEMQGHDRSWLQPMLAAGKAITFSLPVGQAVGSACLAFESYGRVWEIGGVVTSPALRGRGLAARVVETALALLAERGLTARYQANGTNLASIALARKLGLQRFLTLEHHLYAPTGIDAARPGVGPVPGPARPAV